MIAADAPDKAECEQIVRNCDLGELIGWRPLRKYPEHDCTDGCLAPGSSPHRHGELIGYVVYGTTGFIEMDLAGIVYRAASIHNFQED